MSDQKLKDVFPADAQFYLIREKDPRNFFLFFSLLEK